MDHIGIDLGKMNSQVAILTAGGELLERRIPTQRERLTELFARRPKARVLIEAGTGSEWVARVLEGYGHDVIVADPNFAPMYAQRSRRVKTDRRDARALAEACRLGAFRRAHRASDAQRHVRAQICVRESMVRSRTRFVGLVEALLRRDGHRLVRRSVEVFSRRVRELELTGTTRAEVTPLLTLIDSLRAQIKAADEQLAVIAATDPRVARLCTTPGVGPVTAATFVAAVDEVERFANAHQLEAYFGLVPREMSSGERQCRGRITKAGNTRVRWLLVEAAWSILRYEKPETALVRAWANRVAQRRGKRRAVVALARRLAGILYAMLRDGSTYQANHIADKARRSTAA